MTKVIKITVMYSRKYTIRKPNPTKEEIVSTLTRLSQDRCFMDEQEKQAVVYAKNHGLTFKEISQALSYKSANSAFEIYHGLKGGRS